MSKPTKLGKLRGQAVYLTRNGLAVEERDCLRPAMNNEIALFVHQQLGEKELHPLNLDNR